MLLFCVWLFEPHSIHVSSDVSYVVAGQNAASIWSSSPPAATGAPLQSLGKLLYEDMQPTPVTFYIHGGGGEGKNKPITMSYILSGVR